MSDQQSIEQARKERGEQLRALVVSWTNGQTFVESLAAQQSEIAEGKLTLNEEWAAVAEEILGGFMSHSPEKMEWPEEKPQEPEGPKLIIP